MPKTVGAKDLYNSPERKDTAYRGEKSCKAELLPSRLWEGFFIKRTPVGSKIYKEERKWLKLN